MRRLELDTDARTEIQRAADYYDRKQPGLGTRFEKELLRTRKLIVSNPLMFAEEDDGFYVPLDRFPYTIIYKLYTDRILVIAVPHDSQRPGYWHYRIKD